MDRPLVECHPEQRIALTVCHPEPQAKDRNVLAHYDPSVATLPQDDRLSMVSSRSGGSGLGPSG